MHLSQWTFVSSAFVRMDICMFCICPNDYYMFPLKNRVSDSILQAKHRIVFRKCYSNNTMLEMTHLCYQKTTRRMNS